MLFNSTVFKINLGFMRHIHRWLRQTRLLLIVLLASLSLSGCVEYDLGVTFNGANQGTIVQSIKLGERFTAFSSETAQAWLDSLERRAKQLQGKIDRISERELTVTIPFYYGAEFEQKFNQFFNPTDQSDVNSQSQETATTAQVPEIASRVSLNQSNFLLLLRNRLEYDLDLRSLALESSKGSIVVDPGSLLDLQFRLNAPGGIRSLTKGENSIAPQRTQEGHQLVWQLQPGQINHIEAIFWMPSPLGIAAVAIALFVAGGIYLKYNLLPGRAKI